MKLTQTVFRLAPVALVAACVVACDNPPPSHMIEARERMMQEQQQAIQSGHQPGGAGAPGMPPASGQGAPPSAPPKPSGTTG